MVTFGIVSKPLMCTTERQGRKISNNVTWCHHHFLSTWRQKEDGRGQEECMFRLRPLGVARDPLLWGNTCFLLLGNTRLGRQRAPSHTCFIHWQILEKVELQGCVIWDWTGCFSEHFAAQMPLFPCPSGRWKRRRMGSCFISPQQGQPLFTQIDVFV